MTLKPHQFAPPLLILAGLALASMGYTSIDSNEGMRHNRNPFADKQSAYGKLLARLAETTIDRVWHLGVEQIVPHYMSGVSHGAAAPAVVDPKADSDDDHKNHHAHEDHDCAQCRAEKARSILASKVSESPLKAGKRWIQARVVGQHTRTNPNALSPAHLATVYRDIEEMLLRSFKLDPTHYGAYDSYHLFLTTSDYGGNPIANEQAKRIALAAIAAADAESEDPEPRLTAAAAGMNLFLMDGAPYMEKGEPVPLELLKVYNDLIGRCLQRFDEIQAESERRGSWANLSMERQMEIAERAMFAKRTFKQFEVLIARAEARGVKGEGTAEVAGTESDKE